MAVDRQNVADGVVVVHRRVAGGISHPDQAPKIVVDVLDCRLGPKPRHE